MARKLQIKNALCILRSGLDKFRISLILPKIFENPIIVWRRLKGTKYENCIKMIEDYKKEKNKDLTNTTPVHLNDRLIKIIDFFHENTQILDYFNDWVIEMRPYDKYLVEIFKLLFEVADQRLNKSAVSELNNEKEIHKIYQENEKLKINIKAALKSAGLFPKLSTSNLAKAAGQPRTVRTIKRRLSAKDITIGPNKEVRRRRTRRLSSNIEVISTTTFNPIPTNFFPIQAKDLLAAAAATTATAASLFATQIKTTPSTLTLNTHNNTSTSASSSPNTDFTNADNTTAAPPATNSLPTHGRRLRQRPQKTSPNTSRRSSVSSNQSTTSSASAAVGGANSQTSNSSQQSHEDLKQTVNKYFGIVNRIESGENFSIRAKRQLANGQMQYLIEWGETSNNVTPSVTIPNFSSDQTANSQLIESSIII